MPTFVIWSMVFPPFQRTKKSQAETTNNCRLSICYVKPRDKLSLKQSHLESSKKWVSIYIYIYICICILNLQLTCKVICKPSYKYKYELYVVYICMYNCRYVYLQWARCLKHCWSGKLQFLKGLPRAKMAFVDMWDDLILTEYWKPFASTRNAEREQTWH